MTYKRPITIALAAAAIAALGGALQRAHGPGSDPGVTITHAGAALFALAALALIGTWLANARPSTPTGDQTSHPADGSGEDRSVDSDRVYVLASDGNSIIPILGPFPDASAAAAELPLAQRQFDPQEKYSWTIGCTDDHEVVGVANGHFPASAAY